MIALSTMASDMLAAALPPARWRRAVVDKLEGLANEGRAEYISARSGPLDSVHDGVARIAKIVRAMKELAHPARGATRSTCRARCRTRSTSPAATYRYVADVETEFATMPPVCASQRPQPGVLN